MSTSTEASNAPVRDRRRWPWILLVSVILVLGAGYLAISWYLSGLIEDAIKIDQDESPNNVTIVSATEQDVKYTVDDSDYNDIGLLAIETEQGGWTQTSDPQGEGRATRTIDEQQAPPELTAGQVGRFEGYFFYEDPKQGLDLDFENVAVETPLGEAPAWFVPGVKDTWAIFTHGRAASRAEGLRMLAATAANGYPTLLITYRNDDEAPAGNGYSHFGADEWQDLDAAAQYALDNGAKDLVLLGTSAGGATSLAFLDNSSHADKVTAMYLDSPFVNLDQTVDIEATALGLPSFLLPGAKLLSEWRFGVSFSDADYTDNVENYAVTTTVAQGDDDDTEPLEVTESYVDAVNEAFPGTVQFEVFPEATHTASWNVDQPRYNKLLANLLEQSQAS
jgi:dienelactone hydrolase